MTITIDSTGRVVDLNGVRCRIWEGKTSQGVNVVVFIPRIAATDDQDLSQFDNELQEHRKPSAEALSFPLRMIL